MPEDTQPILDYSARDFDTIRSMLVGIGKGVFPEWKTIGEANDFGTLLLEEYAFMGDVMNFYIDRVASEAFLGTAQRRQSVLYIAEQLGYSPIGQRSAIVTLTFTLAADYRNGDVTELLIPSGTWVYSSSEDSTDVTFFETDYAAKVKADESVEILATEGRANTIFSGDSTGAPNQTYQIPDRGVVEGTVSVRLKEGTYEYNDLSDDVPRWVNWQEIPAIASARPTQSVFSTYIDDLGYTYILFGDAASGRIPPAGASVEISYRYGKGAAANDLGTQTLVNFDDGGGLLPTSSLTVTNNDVPVGGSDPESLSSMRFTIPKGAQIRERAVTIEDYQALAMQVPGVAKAVAYGQVYSAVNVTVAPVGGNLDSPTYMAAVRQNVQNYMEPRVLIGSKVYVEDAQWTDFWVRLDLHVLDGFSQEQTQKDVDQSIRNAFSFDNMDLEEKVTIGEIYRRATRIEGVDWVDVTALNSVGYTSSLVENIFVPFGHIARIALPTGEDTPLDETDDTNGLVITAFGGTITES